VGVNKLSTFKKVFKRLACIAASALVCAAAAVGASAAAEGITLYSAIAGTDATIHGWSTNAGNYYNNVMDPATASGMQKDRKQLTAYYMWCPSVGVADNQIMTVSVDTGDIDTEKYGDISGRFYFIDQDGGLLKKLEVGVVCQNKTYVIKNSDITITATGYRSMATITGDIRCAEFDISAVVPEGKTVTGIEIYPLGSERFGGANFGLCGVYLNAGSAAGGADTVYSRYADAFTALEWKINASEYDAVHAYINENFFGTHYFAIKNSSSVIPAGEALTITLPKQNLAKSDYPSATVTFDYTAKTNSEKIDISKTVFKISTDNGASWTEVKALSQKTVGGASEKSYTNQEPGSLSPVYRVTSADIMAAVPAGKSVTDIALVPFGKDNFSGLNFNLCAVNITKGTPAEDAPIVENGSTVLYREAASTKTAFEWVSNNERLFTIITDVDGEKVRSVLWSNTERPDALSANEHFYITVNDLNIKKSEHNAITLGFTYALNAADFNDVDISMFDELEVYVSSDNGKSWSKQAARLAEYNATGESYKTSDTVFGYLFECVTTDLKAVTEGDTITNVKIYPFGKTLMRGGAFRLYEIEILGHTSGYAPKAELLGTAVSGDVKALGEKAVNYMKTMASVKWTTGAPLKVTYPIGGGREMSLTYKTGVEYTGMPYVGVYEGTLDEFNSYVKNGVYTPPAHAVPYVGNDCSSSVHQAWSLIYPVNFRSAQYAVSTLHSGALGVVQRGDYNLGTVPVTDTNTVLKLNGKDKMFEAYAELGAGDGLVRLSYGSHMRMVSAAATVVKNGDKIDGDKSFVTVVEHAGTFKQSDTSTWTVDYKYTFNQLFNEYYLPITCVALVEGKSYEPAFETPGLPDAENLGGGLHGVIVSNYRIEKVVIKVTDSEGEEVSSDSYVNAFRYFSLTRAESNDRIISSLKEGKYTITATASVNGGEKEVFSIKFNVGYPDLLRGDMNSDGAITVEDYFLVQKAMRDPTDLSELQLAAADMTGDGIITLLDVKKAQNTVIGIPGMPVLKLSEQTFDIKDAKYTAAGGAKASDGKLVCDAAGAGLEFTAECTGDIYMNITADKEMTFKATVESGSAEQETITVPKGTSRVKIASGLTADIYDITFVKESADGSASVASIEVKGLIIG